MNFLESKKKVSAAG